MKGRRLRRASPSGRRLILLVRSEAVLPLGRVTPNHSQNASLTVVRPSIKRALSRSTRYYCFLHTWPLFHPHAKGAHCASAMPARMTATPSHCARLVGSCSTKSETARPAGSSDAARTVDKLAGRCGVPRPKKRTGSASPKTPVTAAYGARPLTRAPDAKMLGQATKESTSDPVLTMRPRC